jgi:hypothetical protein
VASPESKRSSKLNRRITLVLVGAFVLFVLIQLVPYRVHNHSTVSEPKWDSPQTRALAVAACYSCHSNHTKTASFEQMAPLSWWITNHVDQGRAALNFSDCRTARENEGSGAVREGSMPPRYYTWFGLHPEAKLSASEKSALADGLAATARLGCQ